MDDAARDALRRHLEAEARHDAAAAAATYVEDAYYENAALGLRFDGRDMVAFQYQASYDVIADLDAEYLWQVEEDDQVVQAGRLRGTVSGSMLGVESGGGRIDLPFVAVIRFRDGLMLGERVWYDLDEFCAQAGLDVAAVRAAARDMGSAISA